MSGSAHTPPPAPTPPAPTPLAPTPLASAPGGDPSMEDILASIRRILNEEEPRAAPSADAAGSPAGEGGVLELTPAMRADPPQAARPAAAPIVPPEPPPEPQPLATSAPEPFPLMTLLPPHPIAEPATPEPAIPEPAIPEPATREEAFGTAPPRAEAKPAEPPSLVAPAAAAAAAASMGELVRRLAGSQSVAVSRNGPTIEDLVREEIRGLVKAWLDENLPRVVERLVRAEIERVVGGQVG